MAEPLAAIRAAILDMSGEDYPLLGLLTDFEDAIRADAFREAREALTDAWFRDLPMPWQDELHPDYNEARDYILSTLLSGEEA